ncbi:NADH dehydrogenase [ubiquinone] 1 alpha subcomplex subunit 13-B isoform B [Micractinium conductrix]|nr:NADH dehydrogenase [ubiquinone] 1 alpha subcomplex subunit 13-B isoform B [Micractinium conductrix]|eukprot:PSC75101.1 NADH dehydrogenase [ubiquinone] 1 alpha subcomplex subunit 13-B isoform B [Micractinium conductrix]
MPVVQDGPPPGGFPSFRYARRVPSTGPSGITLFAAGAAVMAFGFYKVGQSNRERRAQKAANLAARAALVPFLQAEEDRRWVNANQTFLARQEGIMKNVPEYTAGESVYKTRWMPPAKRVGIWE